jgi:hypothetical protein
VLEFMIADLPVVISMKNAYLKEHPKTRITCLILDVLLILTNMIRLLVHGARSY